MKTRICVCILIAAFVALPAAQAGTKEELIRIQNEIRILQKQLSEFDEKYNERLDVLYSLVVQLNDQIAKSNSNLSRMDAALNSRTEDARSQDRSLLAEIRGLSQKIDDITVSISVLAQQFNDYKLQTAMRTEGAGAGLSAESMYNQAFRDYMLGDFEIAIDGFTATVETYPGGETAAKSLLGIGESYVGLNRLKDAAAAFTRVINEFPQAAVVPTALYKRAMVSIGLQERDNAIADFKDIIQRFPTAAEADQARGELRVLENAQKPKPKTTTIPPRKQTSR